MSLSLSFFLSLSLTHTHTHIFNPLSPVHAQKKNTRTPSHRWCLRSLPRLPHTSSFFYSSYRLKPFTHPCPRHRPSGSCSPLLHPGAPLWLPQSSAPSSSPSTAVRNGVCCVSSSEQNGFLSGRHTPTDFHPQVIVSQQDAEDATPVISCTRQCFCQVFV